METEVIRYECDLCGAKAEVDSEMPGMRRFKLSVEGSKEWMNFNACDACFPPPGVHAVCKNVFVRVFEKFFGKGSEK